MIVDQITADLKQALLSGDTFTTTVLRGLKSAIGYAGLSAGKREEGLSDAEVISLFQKEAKKRQESADIYRSAGETERAEKELAEKAVIARYLPAELSEAEIIAIVTAVIAEQNASGPSAMGSVMTAVKLKTGGAADGSLVARIVKERLAV